MDRPGLGFEPFVPTIDGVVIVEEPRVQLRKEDGERLQVRICVHDERFHCQCGSGDVMKKFTPVQNASTSLTSKSETSV